MFCDFYINYKYENFNKKELKNIYQRHVLSYLGQCIIH